MAKTVARPRTRANAKWRAGATGDELATVRRLDLEMMDLQARLTELAAERQLIANRAVQRVRQAERKGDQE